MSEDLSARSEGSSTESQRERDENASNSKASGSYKLRSKKLKHSDETEALEERLNGILCCAVCLDLPKSSVYQCRNGHLVCSDCFNHLLADAQLRMGTAVCPSCRTLISKDLCVRNLVVEKAVSELPVTCQACSTTFPRCLRDIHEKEICLERKSQCCYSRIGCPWVGPFKKKAEHEKRCAQPKKKGSEIKKTLTTLPYEEKANELYRLCNILAADEIAYNDLQLLGPYHTDEYYIRYETFRFCAFGMEWEVRAHVNNNEADPTLSSERTLSYQLLLKEPI
ncbi:Cysteine and histidine-rich protein 1-B, partial [Stegodyphus mimosarum]